MPRIQLFLSGVVQGVGLRPEVVRSARRLGLTGFVSNLGGRVEVQAQGDATQLEQLVERLRALEPPAKIRRLDRESVPERRDESDFRIVDSASSRALPALPADLAPCRACLAEVTGQGRRAQYPFTACTSCGARYSIVRGLPYDRERTTLAEFPLCAGCAEEYGALDDRRFHAQAIACPACGPKLTLLDATGAQHATGSLALELAAQAMQNGQILALKGVGGFQLLCDASDARAVERLRERKRREQKPLAVLFSDVEAAAEHVLLDEAERALLSSPEAPIVLAYRRPDARGSIASSVAPDNPQLGCLLPASPLHYLLARATQRPVVCTSGNSSGEPLCIEEADALERLGGIADVFLSHDRVIARPLDDSVARVGSRGPVLLRRARGFAPRVVAELAESAPTVLALGAELKAAPALLLCGRLVLGQHVGDLGEARTLAVWKRNVADLLEFFEAKPAIVSCDLHPDYASSHYGRELAARLAVPLVSVQHHHAHVAAVMAEHDLRGPVLGFAWDGTGLGSDGTIWGGEALRVDRAGFERLARLPPFRLPGGDAAAREPERSALGVLFSHEPELALERAERLPEGSGLLRALERQLNCPLSSSIGRLFDAVAALAGFRGRVAFEGQAAMQLEFAARDLACADPYELELEWLGPGSGAGSAGLGSLVRGVLRDVAAGASRSRIAARFHAGLVAAASKVAERAGLEEIVLTGGCFQNALLTAALTAALEARGHRVLTAGQIPGNDGGIAAGQAAVTAWRSV